MNKSINNSIDNNIANSISRDSIRRDSERKIREMEDYNSYLLSLSILTSFFSKCIVATYY